MESDMRKEYAVNNYHAAYKEWRRREENKGFRTPLRLYLIIVPILATVNIIFVPQFLWFFFPMVGWGVGITMHYLFGFRRFSSS